MDDKRGIYPPAWFVEWMLEKEGEGHYAKRKPRTKNVILIMINVAALIMAVLGFGVMDQTGSLVAAYPLIIPPFIWWTAFVYVNRDNL